MIFTFWKSVKMLGDRLELGFSIYVKAFSHNATYTKFGQKVPAV